MEHLRFLRRIAALSLAVAAASLAVPAAAATFNLSGTFTRDDNIQLTSVVVASAGTVSVTSTGYAAGGFDSMLFLYSATGTLVAQSDDGIDAVADPVTGLAADAGFSLNLQPGVYRLALTQYDNFALGDWSAGFSNAGAGNFTPTLSGTCGAIRFCDSSGATRTGNWALTIAGVSAVPEAESWALMLVGLAGLGGVSAVRRRSRRDA